MNPVINTSSRLAQVKEYLLNYIAQNKLRHQDPLPSETALAKELGVSRNTLREVYVELEHEGIIIRRHGIGTFVAHSPVIRDPLNDFSPFTQIIRESGFTPNFQTLAVSHDPEPLDICEVFDMPPLSKICCVKRIVRADQTPVIFIKDYLTPALDTEGIDWNAFDGNMVQFLMSTFNLSLHHFQSRIKAAIIDPEFIQYLDVPKGSAILNVRSTIFSEENLPVAYSKLYFNSDFIELNSVRMIHKQDLSSGKE